MKSKKKIEKKLYKSREYLLKHDKQLNALSDEELNTEVSSALYEHITSLESAITVLKWVLK